MENGFADDPNPDDVGVSDTESVDEESSASASEEAPDQVGVEGCWMQWISAPYLREKQW